VAAGNVNFVCEVMHKSVQLKLNRALLALVRSLNM